MKNPKNDHPGYGNRRPESWLRMPSGGFNPGGLKWQQEEEKKSKTQEKKGK